MRPGRSRMIRTLLVALLALASLPARSFASWPHDPNVNVPVCLSAGNQNSPAAISDGAGGVIVAWQDYRGASADLYVQRIDADGHGRWSALGVPLCTATGDQLAPVLVSDGAGGVIAAWTDPRGGANDIYAQWVDADGSVKWATNGVAIAAAPFDQSSPAIATDGAGGAFVCWQDTRNGNNDIYAQRVQPNGVVAWTANGVPICTWTAGQASPVITDAGWNGAVIVWIDGRNGNNDLYTQRLEYNGTVHWTADGIVLCNAANEQSTVRLVRDITDGVIALWMDYRTNSNYDLYAQRLNLSGPMWAVNGVPVCTAVSSQTTPSLAPDGQGGAIAAWADFRNSAYDVFAQRLSPLGVAQWTTDGVAVCTAAGTQSGTAVVADGSGGGIVVWRDARTGSYDLYAQRLSASGGAMWTSTGVALCTAELDQPLPAVVGDGAGAAIATWSDQRDWSTLKLFAQRVDEFGALGAEPVITAVADVPNDEGGRVKVSWDASPLDTDPAFRTIQSYLLFRSAPPNAVARALRAGLAIEEATTLDPGAARGRLVRTSAQGVTYYWEYLGSTDAYHLPGYSFVAPTTADALPGYNPLTAFMVEARAAGGAQWWTSAPDSGYSIDNLAPPAPAPFTGAYGAGNTVLAWGASPAADLACYRLYRGSSSVFAPSPANQIASPTTTSWVDAAGGPYYYRLSAVDLHGNEGPSTLLRPDGTVDVPAAGLPRELWLAAVAPNPARGSAVVRFGLPREAAVTVSVFDTQGRRVRTLLAGVQPAGERALAWDGRDDGGRALPSGLYLCRLECAGEARLRRIALTR